MSDIGAVTAPPGSGSVRVTPGPGNAKAAADTAYVAVAFVCENCGRGGIAPSAGIRRRPTTPDFAWPPGIQQIAVPCAGRLQPEHLLKAIEDGADAVAVICCEEGNCHNLEGNRRCARRIEHVGKMLDEIGLGSGRLAIFHLPGSAAEDMALGLSRPAAAPDPLLTKKISDVREAFLMRLQSLPRSPFRAPAP